MQEADLDCPVKRTWKTTLRGFRAASESGTAAAELFGEVLGKCGVVPGQTLILQTKKKKERRVWERLGGKEGTESLDALLLALIEF